MAAPDTLLQKLRIAFPSGASLHEPKFQGNEWVYVKECLDTGWVSSVGKFVDRFEADLARFTGARHAVACVNGTAALHMCLQLVGVRDGDEVLVPALTFVATANAVTYARAVPHFVDSEVDSLGVDPLKLREHLRSIGTRVERGWKNRKTGRVIRAAVPMHAFGHPCKLGELKQVLDECGIALVEDAAESLGSTIDGKHTGTMGVVGALSFNGNKVVTTGGGGAILTNDSDMARKAKHLTTTAKIPHAWAFEHDEVGFNYRLPNINAALGCAQLEALPSSIRKKRALANWYFRNFGPADGLEILKEPAGTQSNYWLVVARLDKALAKDRDKILDAANDAGIRIRPVWNLIPSLRMYRDCPSGDLSVAKEQERRIICLPSSPFLVESLQ